MNNRGQTKGDEKAKVQSELPLVSVVVLCHNQEKYIREALVSVLDQNYPNLEVVISDDASTDASMQIIQEVVSNYNGKKKIVLSHNEKNLGICGNVSRAYLELATGEYIVKVDGDDVCCPNAISKEVETLKRLNVDSVSFNMSIINSDSQLTGKTFYSDTTSEDEVYSLEDYLLGRVKFAGACRMFRQSIFCQFGPFLEGTPADDSPLLLRSLLCGHVGFCHVPNHKYRKHDSNITNLHSMMTVVDAAGMYNQYKHDIDFAFSKKLISKDMLAKLQAKIEEYLRSRLAIQKLYSKKGFLKRLLYAATYLFRSGYSIGNVHWLMSTAREWQRKGV